MAEFVAVADVRDYLTVTNVTGQWSSPLIGSNIAAASAFLQHRSGRLFEPSSNVTKTFSSMGNSFLAIPDLRTTTGVTLNGVSLSVNDSYYLIGDQNNSGVFTGIEFPAYRYGRRRDWIPGQNYHGLNGFDVNYNHLGNYTDYSLPNDVVIGPGNWGHVPYPSELQLVTKVLAAWYCIRPDALFSGTRQTPEGNVFDLSALPAEVQDFITEWRADSPSVGTAG